MVVSQAPRGFADKVIFSGIAVMLTSMFGAFIYLQAFLVMSVSETNVRLTAIETVIRENTAERQAQINELRLRLNRVEDRR